MITLFCFFLQLVSKQSMNDSTLKRAELKKLHFQKKKMVLWRN